MFEVRLVSNKIASTNGINFKLKFMRK